MSPSLRASVRRILFTAGMMAAAGTATAEPQAAPSNEIAEIVIVTGSYIRGTAEDAALPIDVVTAEDLQKQGSPTMVDLIKSIPAMQGIIGESNQFLVNQGAGTANVNLRGLGATRTLVLLNGRRMAGSTTGNGVDTNLLPAAAIGRVEVLKDGAAATYGSDAIGGVVNFITKVNQSGLSLDGSYSYIDGSDGDYTANASWGWQGDNSSGLVAASYRHRSELSSLDRDWAVRSLDDNPQGGWSLAGTGTYLAGAGFGTRIYDPACEALGGVIVAPSCRFQYIAYDNIVEKEDHYQVFADYNLDISDSVSFHAEALWAMHDVPEEQVSPTYGPNQGANGGAPNYFIPLTNPGLQTLLPFLTPTERATVAGTGGVLASGLLWRPLATGGNPVTGGAQENSRKFDGLRVSAGFSGEFAGGVSWNTAATYSENNSEISTPDVLVSRLGRALSGLGGADCNGIRAGLDGSTCLWFNPFSTAIAENLATGAQNTVSYVPGQENNPDVIRWMTTPNSYEAQTTLAVFDVVFSGESGLTLPGGNIGWAAGAQYREDGYELKVTDDFANSALNPCAASPVNPAATCTVQNGALSFYGLQTAQDVSRDMYAVFGELSVPILDSLQAQLAIRYEDYGGNVGSTTNPKLSLRWQATDWLALRGSAGTTFRAPTQTSLQPGFETTLAYIYGSYRPIDTYGNPDLKPETADTYNVGFIVKAGGFGATIDYWNFKFEDALTTENAGQILTTFFGAGGSPHCGDPAYAALEARFTFTAAGCSSANLLRTQVNVINARSAVDISGIDASLYYQFENVLAGDLTLGVDGTYNLKYELGPNVVDGFQTDPATDAVGTRGGRGGTQVQWKGAAYVELATGMHNVRWTTRYVDGLEDKRGGSTFATNTNAQFIDAFLTHDLTYRAQLPSDLTLSASVFNVFDEDPSYARLDLSYEPFIANPLGRYYKVGLAKKF